MKLIDWFHYQVLHDEFENHEIRANTNASLCPMWIHLLWVLAMTCTLCEDIEDVLFEVGLWCPMCREEEE